MPFFQRASILFSPAALLFPIAACTLLPLAGCRSAGHRAGDAVPVASPDSRALPDTSTAADAPHAPSTSTGRDHTTHFTDPRTGVSFEYPSSWRPLSAADPMYRPAFEQGAGKATGTQAMMGAASTFRQTNLVGIDFSWMARPGVASDACGELARHALQAKDGKPEVVNAVEFMRFDGSDAGMCHQMAHTIDAAAHNGICYLFERDMETVCPGVSGPGKDIALTDAQRGELQRQLDAVMASVQIR